jgi:hypothetical protein
MEKIIIVQKEKWVGGGGGGRGKGGGENTSASKIHSSGSEYHFSGFKGSNFLSLAYLSKKMRLLAGFLHNARCLLVVAVGSEEKWEEKKRGREEERKIGIRKYNASTGTLILWTWRWGTGPSTLLIC